MCCQSIVSDRVVVQQPCRVKRAAKQLGEETASRCESQRDSSAIELSEQSHPAWWTLLFYASRSIQARQVEEQKSTRRGFASSTHLQRPTMQNQAIVVNGKSHSITTPRPLYLPACTRAQSAPSARTAAKPNSPTSRQQRRVLDTEAGVSVSAENWADPFNPRVAQTVADVIRTCLFVHRPAPRLLV